jgi:hypothetical protein
VVAALGGVRGKPGRIARAAAAEAYRAALLAALPPDLPDRGDAIVDALRTIRQRDMERLRTVTIAAVQEALRGSGNEPPLADVIEPGPQSM